MKRRKSQGLAWSLVTIILVVGLYFFFPDVFPIQDTQQPPTPTPAVLGAPSVSIGHPSKTTGCVSNGVLPDSGCTPGEIDHNVTQVDADGTICIVGYSSKVRPPTSVTNKIKESQLAAYGFTGPMSDYELDHLISLELGGCANCVDNLWPEPYNIAMGAREKDKVENYLHKAVCNGEMTLSEAQYEIATDWTAVYYRIYGK